MCCGDQCLQYIPRNMHTVFALLCFVVVIHWLIFPYPPGLLHWHCGNLTIAPVPAKQPWWIWINTSFEFIMNDYITTTKQSTTKPCAYFLGYTVCNPWWWHAMEMVLSVTDGFSSQLVVMRTFGVSLLLANQICPAKSCYQWFETRWCLCNVTVNLWNAFWKTKIRDRNLQYLTRPLVAPIAHGLIFTWQINHPTYICSLIDSQWINVWINLARRFLGSVH